MLGHQGRRFIFLAFGRKLCLKMMNKEDVLPFIASAMQNEIGQGTLFVVTFSIAS
jgi:hypothetical protein